MDELKKLNELADEGCRCTPDQQTGKDHTRCIGCMACGALNTIGEIAREELADIAKQTERFSNDLKGATQSEVRQR